MVPSTWWQRTTLWGLCLLCLSGSFAVAQEWRPAYPQPNNFQPAPPMQSGANEQRSQMRVRVPVDPHRAAPQYVQPSQADWNRPPVPQSGTLQEWLNPPATLDQWLADPNALPYQEWPRSAQPQAQSQQTAYPPTHFPNTTQRASYQDDPAPRFFPANAQRDIQSSKTLEERLEELEEEFEDLQQDGPNKDFAKSFEEVEKYVDKLKDKEAANKKKPTLKINGRIHLDTILIPGDSPLVNFIERASPTESPEDRVRFRRMRINTAGDLPLNMSYKLELEMPGGNASQYRDVYIGWKKLPYLQTFLIGNQKRPYGLDHLNSSRFNIFMERPFIIEAFNEDARRIGAASYGVSDDLAYNWRFGVYMGEIAQADAGPIGDYWQAELAGRFANTIWYDESSDGRGYAHWAIAGTIADPAPDGDGTGRTGTGQHQSTAQFRQRPEIRTSQRWLDTGVINNAELYELIGLEGVFNAGPLQIVGEYQNMWMQRQAGDEDLFFWGGYVYASYFLTGEHMPWDRAKGTIGRPKPFQDFFRVRTCDDTIESGWGAWQVAARYSYADLSNNDIRGGVGQTLTLGLVWYFNPYANVQFNYILGEIRDTRFTNLANQDGFDVGADGGYRAIGIRWRMDY